MHHICTLSTDWLMFAQCWHMSAQYTCIDVLCNASNYSSYQTMQSSTKLFQDVSRYSAAQFWSLSPLASWTSQVGVDTQGPDWSNDGVVQSRPSCHLGCISDISRFAIRRTMEKVPEPRTVWCIPLLPASFPRRCRNWHSGQSLNVNVD